MEQVQRKYANVYAQAASSRKGQTTGPDFSGDMVRIGQVLERKVDRSEMASEMSCKVNQMDIDPMKIQLEGMFKQLQYLSATTVGLTKLQLVDDPKQSKMLRSQQKAQTLMQAERVWSWVVKMSDRSGTQLPDVEQKYRPKTPPGGEDAGRPPTPRKSSFVTCPYSSTDVAGTVKESAAEGATDGPRHRDRPAPRHSGGLSFMGGR